MNAKRSKYSFVKRFNEQYQKLKIKPGKFLQNNIRNEIGRGIVVNSLTDFSGSHESTEQQLIRKVHTLENNPDHITEKQLRHSEKVGNEIHNLIPIFTMSTSGDVLQTSQQSSNDYFHPPKHVDNRLAGTGSKLFTHNSVIMKNKVLGLKKAVRGKPKMVKKNVKGLKRNGDAVHQRQDKE